MKSAVHSKLYTGTVVHARHAPAKHVFRYRISMFYLDLDELPEVLEFGRFASASRKALIRFNRADYIGEPGTTLASAVRTLVAERTGVLCEGPIRLLTHPRYVGYVFNPVSFYYVFNREDETVDFVVAQITNTPWGERHSYVLDCRTHGDPDDLRFQFDKQFHVSPFMPMTQAYDWRFSSPGQQLAVHMKSAEGSERVFDATLALAASPLDGAAIRRALVQFPLMSFKVVGGIYWNALRLFLKRTPFHSHPKSRPGEEART